MKAKAARETQQVHASTSHRPEHFLADQQEPKKQMVSCTVLKGQPSDAVTGKQVGTAGNCLAVSSYSPEDAWQCHTDLCFAGTAVPTALNTSGEALVDLTVVFFARSVLCLLLDQ